jgi:hypothetical protein
MGATNGLGISNAYLKSADQTFTSSAVLASIGLGDTTNPAVAGLPIAANQKVKVKYWVKCTVGATGGIRAQIAVPAGGTLFSATFRSNNSVADTVALVTQQATAAFTDALANAGTHWLEVEATIINGSTAGRVDLQMAQNTSDALTLTILAGSSLEAQYL